VELGIAGRRAAVAASSAGLGKATALALAQEGVIVAICSRTRDRIDAAAADIHGSIPLVADVSTEAGAIAFIQEATEALGGLDIVVANGGGPPPGTFASTDLSLYRQAIEQNCLSSIAMCSESVPAMQAQGWGRVLAITSVSVRQPLANLILSNTARAGLTGFLKTLAREVAADGVTVNSIQPGSHDTERIRQMHAGTPSTDVGALGRPDDFGRIAAFLCSDAARFVNGAALNVDGGSYQGLQ
jgi:3-oxoacyl-[acyl-carrier protein] reductase